MKMHESIPKTLIVDLSLDYGGSSSRVLSLLKHLPSSRVALAGLEKGAITHRARYHGHAVHIVGTRKFDPGIIFRLVRLVRDGGYQVLDTQNIQSKVWASLAAGMSGTALISTIHSWYSAEHGGSWKGRVYQLLENASNRNLDLCITVSSTDSARLLDTGFPERKICQILNSIDIDPEAISGDAAWLKRTCNLPENAVVCCAVGRLVWAKGYTHLIDALFGLSGKCPNLYCLLVGDGQLRPDLEKQIRDYGLQEKVRLLGFREPDEVLSIVKSSDIFVMPSLSEGTPVALLEAAALARPLLASRVGGIPELVADGQQALLISPGDHAALAAGLERLCAEPEFARRLGMQAQRKVSEQFSVRSQIDATAGAYQLAWKFSRERFSA
jgi:glycosyltransferase involved in cell wall biosynthesis